MAKNPTEVAQKYSRRVSQAQPDYEAGVKNPKRSWSQAYKDSETRMANAYSQALANGKMRRGVDRVGDQGWQQAAISKASRYAQSAQTAGAKYAERVADIIAAGEAGASASRQIPGDTFEGRLERMSANARAINSYWKNRS
jgi:hypothetical protein